MNKPLCFCFNSFKKKQKSKLNNQLTIHELETSRVEDQNSVRCCNPRVEILSYVAVQNLDPGEGGLYNNRVVLKLQREELVVAAARGAVDELELLRLLQGPSGRQLLDRFPSYQVHLGIDRDAARDRNRAVVFGCDEFLNCRLAEPDFIAAQPHGVDFQLSGL